EASFRIRRIGDHPQPRIEHTLANAGPNLAIGTKLGEWRTSAPGRPTGKAVGHEPNQLRDGRWPQNRGAATGFYAHRLAIALKDFDRLCCHDPRRELAKIPVRIPGPRRGTPIRRIRTPGDFTVRFVRPRGETRLIGI